MHYEFCQLQKFGNKEYTYELITYWDKESKKVRHKIRYPGVLADKEKKKPLEKLILDFGDGYTIYEFLKKTGIGDLIKEVFRSEGAKGNDSLQVV